MRKIFILIVSILVSVSAFAQGSSNLSGLPSLQSLISGTSIDTINTTIPQQNISSPSQINTQQSKSKNAKKGSANKNKLTKLNIFKKPVYTQSSIEVYFNKTYRNFLHNKILKQFGYIFFRKTKKPSAPVSDNYILGPGDKLVVYLWGNPVEMMVLPSEFKLKVSKSGTVYVPNIGIINVAGISIGDLKHIIKSKLGSKFKNLKVDITLTKLRTFNVYVTGFVRHPGVISVNPLDTIIDALYKAGGVSKEGTLRDIEIKREENGTLKVYHIDLYKLFIEGNPINISLKDGDVIYVPPIGKVIAIAGDVKRPGIYELKNEKDLKDILKFAGGFNPSVNGAFARIARISKNGVKVFEGSLNKSFLNTKLKNGDFVYFGIKPNVLRNAVFVEGDVYYPGVYSLKSTKTLKELLEKVKPTVNAYYVRVLKANNEQFSVNIKDVLSGKFNYILSPSDKIFVYNKLFNIKPIYVSGDVSPNRTVPYYKGIKLLDVLTNANFKYPLRELEAVVLRNHNPLATIYLYKLLVRYDAKYNIPLMPGDVVIIKRALEIESAPSVSVLGEVVYPGKYTIYPGETLYDVIKRAGGYTYDAYPQELIFIRKSAIKLQQEQLNLAMSTITQNFSRAALGLSFSNSQEEKTAKLAIAQEKNLINLIQKRAQMYLGRIALDIPPTLNMLKASNQNIVLEDGDTIIVPPRPDYVLVLGDVYNPTALPYVKGKTISYYLKMVGGPAQDADISHMYVIRANGRVVSQSSFTKVYLLWNGFDHYRPHPGDTIVVPVKLHVPINWENIISNTSQVVFQALAAAVLAKQL